MYIISEALRYGARSQGITIFARLCALATTSATCAVVDRSAQTTSPKSRTEGTRGNTELLMVIRWATTCCPIFNIQH